MLNGDRRLHFCHRIRIAQELHRDVSQGLSLSSPSIGQVVIAAARRIAHIGRYIGHYGCDLRIHRAQLQRQFSSSRSANHGDPVGQYFRAFHHPIERDPEVLERNGFQVAWKVRTAKIGQRESNISVRREPGRFLKRFAAFRPSDDQHCRSWSADVREKKRAMNLPIYFDLAHRVGDLALLQLRNREMLTLPEQLKLNCLRT